MTPTTATPPPPATAAPARRRAWYAQPGFVVVAVILLTAGVGLTAATQFLQLHFKKRPVPLRAALDDPAAGVPRELGPWVMVSRDAPLDEEMQLALGTDRYVFRTYVDTRVATPPDLAAMRDLDRAWAVEVARFGRAHPAAVVNLAVTYYTGSADTVPHVPDRCYVADGYQPTAYDTVAWDVGPTAAGGARLPARVIDFEDQTGVGRVNRTVAYFFHVNGGYESDPLGVRARLQNLFESYGYFAKVEVMTQMVPRERSAAVMTDFLSAALPAVERCLPDYAQYRGRRGE